MIKNRGYAIQMLVGLCLLGLIFISGCRPDRCANQSGLNLDTLSAYEARVIDSARYVFYAANGYLKFTYEDEKRSIYEFDTPIESLRYSGDTIEVNFAIRDDAIIDLYRLKDEQEQEFVNFYTSTFGFYNKNGTPTLVYTSMHFLETRFTYEPFYNNKGVYIDFNRFFEKALERSLANYSGKLNCWLRERALKRGWTKIEDK